MPTPTQPNLSQQKRDAYNQATDSEILGAILNFTDDMIINVLRSMGLPESEIQKRNKEIIASLKKDPYTLDSFLKLIKKGLGMDAEQPVNNSIGEDHYDEPANDYEEEMVINQVAFIKYAADEIEDHVRDGGVFPEWFQNKLSGVHSEIKGLHAYMEGERQQAKRKQMVAMKDAEDDYFETLESRLAQEQKYPLAKPGNPTYYVRMKNGKPVLEVTAGKFAPIIASNKWTEITPAITQKAERQGFSTVPIESPNGKQFQALLGWMESKKTEVAFVSAKDFAQLNAPAKDPGTNYAGDGTPIGPKSGDAGPDGGMR